MSRERARLFAPALLVLALAWLGFALLAVVPAPTYLAWQLSVFATELGHLVAPLGLLFLLGWRGSRGARMAAGLGWLGSLLLLTPLLRAIPVMRDVAAHDPPALDARYRLVPGGLPRIAPQRLNYARRDSIDLALDFYVPRSRGDETAPVVVVIHGGSWAAGDPGQLPALNSILAARGYAVAAIAYRLAPRWTHPAQVDDVRAALHWLRAHADSLNIDAQRIVLLGRSAGGHLALLAAYTAHDPGIRGVVSFYAPTDLIWGWENPAPKRVIDSRGVLARFLGGTPADSRTTFVRASPISHAVGAPATLLLHGTRDVLVSVWNQRRLVVALAEAGVDVRAIELPWATHGCDYAANGPCGQISTRAVVQFLERVAPVSR